MCQTPITFTLPNGRKMTTGCGHCPSCLQRKANKRTRKIRDHHPVGYVPLFFGLTYSNLCVPFVIINELQNKTVDIYRNCEIKWVRGKNDKRNGKVRFVRKITRGLHRIDTVQVNNHEGFKDLKPLRKFKENGRLLKSFAGVIYKPDIYKFFKRLRQNLIRKYDTKDKFYYTQCSEYGEDTQRPHFHVILWCPVGKIEIFKRAIAASWSYDDFSRTYKSIEIARDAASYVSSYVNCFSTLPPCLYDTSEIRPSLSHSKNFGLDNPAFSLDKICECIDRGSLLYDATVVKDGKKFVAPLPYPKYVIDRYFSKIRGYSSFTPDTLQSIAEQPARLLRFVPNSKTRAFLNVKGGLVVDRTWSDSDINSQIVKLGNLRKRFKSAGIAICMFPYYYYRVWSVYYSTLLKFCNGSIPLSAFFDNYNDCAGGFVDGDWVDFDGMFFNSTSEHPYNVSQDSYYEHMFYERDKSRKDSNHYSSLKNSHL